MLQHSTVGRTYSQGSTRFTNNNDDIKDSIITSPTVDMSSMHINDREDEVTACVLSILKYNITQQQMPIKAVDFYNVCNSCWFVSAAYFLEIVPIL